MACAYPTGGIAHQMGLWTPLTYAACKVAVCSNRVGDK
ncbi:unnamed protein product [Acidithrix sp. C25]|nr:unnamed protein product [Acidithrix sp. C25]